MLVNEIRIAGAHGIEIPNVEVDDEFTLEVRLRVFALQREDVDVSDASGEASLPGSLRLEAVAVPVEGWPEPAPLPPDYWETAQ